MRERASEIERGGGRGGREGGMDKLIEGEERQRGRGRVRASE